MISGHISRGQPAALYCTVTNIARGGQHSTRTGHGRTASRPRARKSQHSSPYTTPRKNTSRRTVCVFAAATSQARQHVHCARTHAVSDARQVSSCRLSHTSLVSPAFLFRDRHRARTSMDSQGQQGLSPLLHSSGLFSRPLLRVVHSGSPASPLGSSACPIGSIDWHELGCWRHGLLLLLLLRWRLLRRLCLMLRLLL